MKMAITLMHTSAALHQNLLLHGSDDVREWKFHVCKYRRLSACFLGTNRKGTPQSDERLLLLPSSSKTRSLKAAVISSSSLHDARNLADSAIARAFQVSVILTGLQFSSLHIAPALAVAAADAPSGGAEAAAAAAAAAAVAAACAEELGGADLNVVIAVACVLELVALVGAAVGGILARERKNEVEKVNAQLRQINIALRRQARLESYAPGLSYAPVLKLSTAAAAAAPAAEQEKAPALERDLNGSASGERKAAQREEVIRYLKAGKRCLREGEPAAAFTEFERALVLARAIGDAVEEKKAIRGLGASCQRQGKYAEALKYHETILEKSRETGEDSGMTEAFGAIADCYAELGDLENAAKFYDSYISGLQSD